MERDPGGAEQLIEARRAWVDTRRRAQSDEQHKPFTRRAIVPRRRVLAEHGDAWTDRPPSSRVLHRLGEITAYAATGLAVAVGLVVWFGVGLATGFPGWWEVALTTTGTSITLVMVFAIQHTQSRQEVAIQRKLDELLRAMPNADNRLISAEDATDDELHALAQLNLRDRVTEGSHGPP
jgi:low affinity Fe/Cu permease